MKRYDNIHKKNVFTDELEQQAPLAFAAFCKWIDDYKKAHDWAKLVAPGIKFHDLPYEMQGGIFQRFLVEMSEGADTFREKYAIGAMQKQMKDALCFLNDKLAEFGNTAQKN